MKQTSITTANVQRFRLLLAVSVIIPIAVGASYWAVSKALKAETNVRYSGLQSYVASELCRTIKGMELSAENVFNEVEKHLVSPDAVIAALESESNLKVTLLLSNPTISRRRADGLNHTFIIPIVPNLR